MKSAIAIASFIGLAAAQFQGLPNCAQACAGTFLANGIGNCGSDPKCICQDKSFIGDIACCLAKPGGCNAADQSSAVNFASQLCAANGVSVPSAVSCTATSTGGSAAATDATTTGTAKATTTATATGTARETTTATATGAATTGSSSSSSSSSATGTTTGAAATGATTGSASSAGAQTTSASSSTSNPAQRETAGVMALVGGVAAALAML